MRKTLFEKVDSFIMACFDGDKIVDFIMQIVCTFIAIIGFIAWQAFLTMICS